MFLTNSVFLNALELFIAGSYTENASNLKS